jgi:hypothetical protein
MSIDSSDSLQPCPDAVCDVQPNYPSPLVQSNDAVIYNADRGTAYGTSLLLGTPRASSGIGQGSYRSRYLWYNPVTSSLQLGQELNSTWANSGQFSLSAGLANTNTATSSLVTGSYNTISNTGISPPPSSLADCSIVGGTRCEIVNSSSSSLVGCQAVVINQSTNTVAVGLSNTTINNEENSVYLSKTHIEGDLVVTGTLTVLTPPPDTGIEYVKGTTQLDASTVLVYALDQADITLTIPMLPSQVVTVKNLSDRIVRITPPIGSSIETYDSNNGRREQLVTSPNGTYVINTAGGCVSLAYCSVLRPPGWVILQQFVGSTRAS